MIYSMKPMHTFMNNNFAICLGYVFMALWIYLNYSVKWDTVTTCWYLIFFNSPTKRCIIIIYIESRNSYKFMRVTKAKDISQQIVKYLIWNITCYKAFNKSYKQLENVDRYVYSVIYIVLKVLFLAHWYGKRHGLDNDYVSFFPVFIQRQRKIKLFILVRNYSFLCVCVVMYFFANSKSAKNI